MLKPILSFYILFIVNILYLCSSNNEQNYGKFTLQLSEISMCKGPKRSECSNNNARIENRSHMLINMDVQKNVIPTRGKVLVLLNGQTLVRLQMKKPCDHVFLKPVFQKLLNVTQYCEFAKGIYNLNLDLESLVQKYYGGMFYYGNLTFKSLLYNNECNFFCIVEKVILSPKNITKPK